MWSLARKEVIQLRSHLIQIFLALTAVILIVGNNSPQFAFGYLNVFPVVMAMTLPQVIFTYEERSNTFVYLRSLPVRPRQIVAAKYVVSALVLLGLLALDLGFGYFVLTLDRTLLATLALTVLAAGFLLGLSLYTHFRCGLNAARIVLLVVLFAVGLPGLLIAKQMEDPQSLTGLLASLQSARDFVGTGAGLLLALVAASFLLWLSYLASVRIFTRRDVSQLP